MTSNIIRPQHRRDEGIGVGGVTSEIDWLGRRRRSIPLAELIAGLRRRFGSSLIQAYAAVEMAEKFGAVTVTKSQRVAVVREK